MTRVFSFFGFLFGFVGMCLLLAGVTQSTEVSAREDTASSCAYVSMLDDGYGIGASQPAACAEIRN